VEASIREKTLISSRTNAAVVEYFFKIYIFICAFSFSASLSFPLSFFLSLKIWVMRRLLRSLSGNDKSSPLRQWQVGADLCVIYFRS
jgi:hypothetical protein